MTVTIAFGWWLVPAAITVGLMFAAAFAARRLAGGDDSGTGLLMFPASLVALLLIGLVWWAYFGWFA